MTLLVSLTLLAAILWQTLITQPVPATERYERDG